MAEHWTDRVWNQAVESRERMRQSMQKVVQRPVFRRPDTKTLIAQAIADPASVDFSGRERLAQWAQDTYGESARNILPYLGTEEEGEL